MICMHLNIGHICYHCTSSSIWSFEVVYTCNV